MKIYFLLFFCLFLFVFPFNSVKAINQNDVVISEIAWMGTEIQLVEAKNWWRYEWLELYNNTPNTINLSGWKLELYRDGLDWNLPLYNNIPGQGYFLIVSSEKISSIFDLNYQNLGGKLNNSGQKIILKDNLGNIIDEIDCFSSKKWFAGNNETKQTMEKTNLALSGNNENNWQNSQKAGGTPKIKNSILLETTPAPLEVKTLESFAPTPILSVTPVPLIKEVVYPENILINEILPSPIGQDETEEWIELFNNNNFEVDISFFVISDSIGKITKFIIPEKTRITAFGYLIFPRPLTKIILNNDEDSISLFSPDNILIENIGYKNAPQGQSFNRTLNDWGWSENLSPGAKNILLSPSPSVSLENKPKEAINKDIGKNNGKELASLETQFPFEKSGFPINIALPIAILGGFAILFLKILLRKN